MTASSEARTNLLLSNPESKEKAFELLVRQNQERLYFVIKRMIKNHDDASDVLQNVFIKVWKNLDSFREDAALFTWMYRICINESLNFLDSQKRKSTVPLSEDISNSEQFGQNGKLQDAEAIEALLIRAMETLPEKQLAVFQLRYYEEMPYEEMSVLLQTSEGALKASYHHAAKKVEAFLKAALNF